MTSERQVNMSTYALETPQNYIYEVLKLSDDEIAKIEKENALPPRKYGDSELYDCDNEYLCFPWGKWHYNSKNFYRSRKHRDLYPFLSFVTINEECIDHDQIAKDYNFSDDLTYWFDYDSAFDEEAKTFWYLKDILTDKEEEIKIEIKKKDLDEKYTVKKERIYAVVKKKEACRIDGYFHYLSKRVEDLYKKERGIYTKYYLPDKAYVHCSKEMIKAIEEEMEYVKEEIEEEEYGKLIISSDAFKNSEANNIFYYECHTDS